jgi:hypothetical protein
MRTFGVSERFFAIKNSNAPIPKEDDDIIPNRRGDQK